jgi:hypothetical protein
MPSLNDKEDLQEFKERAQSVYVLFIQSRTWIDKEGRRHLIAEMEPRYRGNVVRFLRARAPGLAHLFYWGTAFNPPQFGGEMAQLAAEQELDRWAEWASERLESDPWAILADTPLVQALEVV